MDEVVLLNDAFRIYNLNSTPDLSKKILDYILLRLIANKENIETMIEMLNADISFNDILSAFKDAYREKDFYKNSSSYKQGSDYYSGNFPVPIGNILVETNSVLDIVKYFVGGIKSRNTITISQTDYYELSLSNMLLIIFVEALAKFNLSRNTLMILPFEECFPANFDEVVEIENSKTSIKQKPFTSKNIIYIEDHSFDIEVEQEVARLKAKNLLFEVVDTSFDDVLKKAKYEKPKSVAIYTKNPNLAYDFITLVDSQNVFVNSSILNSEELNDKIHNFYYKKKIMFPSGKELNLDKYYKSYINKQEEPIDLFVNNNPGKKVNNVTVAKPDAETNKNIFLVEVVNPWYKRIFERIKKLFKK